MRVAAEILLTKKQREELTKLVNSKLTSVRLALRARIVLLSADGWQNQEIANELKVGRVQVSRWRNRFADVGLDGIVRDLPRGAPEKKVDVKKLVELTTQSKPDAATHWSTRKMGEKLGISAASVSRHWRANGLKPHLVHSFKVSRDPKFVEKLEDIVGLYLTPPEHAIVLCCDEKSQIQALDRTQPGLKLKKGVAGSRPVTHPELAPRLPLSTCADAPECEARVCRRTVAKWGAASAFSVAWTLAASDASALETCINGPSAYGGAIDPQAISAVIALGPRCVRVPFRQDVWSSVDDPTPHGPSNAGILATYDALIAKYLASGIEPYMLFHGETTGQDQHVVNDAAGRATWVAAITTLIDHFKPRVRRFELLNEPNNWDASKSPINPPDAFAAVLADAYTAVKVAHPGDACWDVSLVSGGLFGFQQLGGSASSGHDYLAQTYDAGIASHGWDVIKAKTGSYPLDAVGWHFYGDPGDASNALVSVLQKQIGEMTAVVAQKEQTTPGEKSHLQSLD